MDFGSYLDNDSDPGIFNGMNFLTEFLLLRDGIDLGSDVNKTKFLRPRPPEIKALRGFNF